MPISSLRSREWRCSLTVATGMAAPPTAQPQRPMENSGEASSQQIGFVERGPLSRHLRQRESAGLALNINVLGEAVLGEREASERLRRVLEMMQRDEVDYVSVKLSSLVSQIATIDHEGSLRRAREKLLPLFRASKQNGVFVNLDMEEFRDLRLTVDAFCSILGEEEFLRLNAGIVLQAYLPESHHVLEELVAWSQARHALHGSHIKIRLVKGANLAMEHAEAKMHGWTPAPYATKAAVDASYLRLVDVALRSEVGDAVRIGVASHNLFCVSWALAVAQQRGVLERLDIEMLEGMANAEAAALAKSGHVVLLYAPVTQRDDFAAAVAYLVRRLDENTSDENYLKAAFYIARDPKIFADQQQRFLDAVASRHTVDVASRRHGARRAELTNHFANCSDGDGTDPQYVAQIKKALEQISTGPLFAIPLVVDGAEIDAGQWEQGHDPNDSGRVWYRYSVATKDHVEAALQSAKRAGSEWGAHSCEDRRVVLEHVATVMERARASTIATMARDTGKSVSEGDPEVSEAIDFARYYAHHAHDAPGSMPLGVVLIVPPWNFPYAIPAGGVSAALAAGNAVILKPAPEAVATAFELAQQFWRGGVPRDVLQFVPTRDDDVGRYLVTHDDVGAVVLTGSFDTAALFTSWKPSINLLAETSGKNAITITSCADIDLAVKDLVQSAFGHAGQKCSAASLAIVEQSIYDHPDFFRQLSDAVSSLHVGRASDLGTSVGPIIRAAEPSLERALTQLDPGESWLVEPAALDEGGLMWRPGVKVGVQPDSWSHLHEWFGPVLAVMPAPDFLTALDWQNRVPYALTAGLHSLDEGECDVWIEQVQAGNLYVNRGITGAVVNRQPFGGWKRSSVGPTVKAGGRNYVNCLRRWSPVTDATCAMKDFQDWWDEFGSRARDETGLGVEVNVHRYRYPLSPTILRIDSAFTKDEADFLKCIAGTTGCSMSLSAASGIDYEGVVHESVEELLERSQPWGRIRWLSHEVPPVMAMLERGTTLDRRPLAQSGYMEGPRWLLEQSVAVTAHRYGNVNAGPRPRCPGLSEIRP